MKRTNSSLLAVTLMMSLLLAVLNACNTSSKAAEGLSPDTLALADQKMKAYVEEGKLPCVSTLVIKNGEVAHRSTFGFANIEEKRQLGEDAIFRIYSMFQAHHGSSTDDPV